MRPALPRLKENVSLLYDAALSLVFPFECRVCGASVEKRADVPACSGCWRDTQIFSDEDALCSKCGAPNASPKSATRSFCPRCVSEPYSAARSIGPYDKALRAAVLSLKREPVVGKRLSNLIFEAQSREPVNMASVIVPVPLHPERERHRGFNQASILGHSLQGSSGVELDCESLIRTKDSDSHRAGMDRVSRRESVSGAFRVARPRLVQGRRVLLVDDVFTTGATAASCSAALLEAGAKEVYVLTVARA